MEEKQIKSRDRIRDLAEVYTNKREVNAMLDLIPNEFKNDLKKITSRFLEPSCGNGAFLREILKRKLDIVKSFHDTNIKNRENLYMYHSLRALSSIYGIDICPENVQESKDFLRSIMHEYYDTTLNSEQHFRYKSQYRQSIDYILNTNIQCGNTLDPKSTIVFTQYTAPHKFKFKQEQFKFTDLKQKNPIPIKTIQETHFLKLAEKNLFSDFD